MCGNATSGRRLPTEYRDRYLQLSSERAEKNLLSLIVEPTLHAILEAEEARGARDVSDLGDTVRIELLITDSERGRKFVQHADVRLVRDDIKL
jgi:hypothetical protein